jgi:hypothetical protein
LHGPSCMARFGLAWSAACLTGTANPIRTQSIICS